jgi:hypothetical protein
MECIEEEKAEAQECSRGGAWQVRLAGAQRGQAAVQPRERPQGRPGQQPQEDHRRAAQRPPAPALERSVLQPQSQEVLNAVIALIRARFGDVAIGLGEFGIHYRAAAPYRPGPLRLRINRAANR